MRLGKKVHWRAILPVFQRRSPFLTNRDPRLQHVFVILFRYDTSDIIDIADLVFVQLYFQVCRAGIQDNPGHERQIQGNAKSHARPHGAAAGLFKYTLFGF